MPTQDKKVIAQQLARLLSQTPGAEILTAMRDLGLFAPHAAPPPEPSARVPAAQRGDSERIGVWKRESRDGAPRFVRSPLPHTWPGSWADVELIEPKRGKRVVLLGESVARGMHYDPYLTPARVLEQLLQSVPGLESPDVVDLARIDGTLGYLAETLPRVLQLEPDVIVVFAGNNWKADLHLTQLEDPYRQERIIQQGGGLAGIRAFREQRLARVARGYVQLVRNLSRATRVPVLHVLPEFNLLDWTPPSLRSCPWLAEDGNVRWAALLVALEQAQAARDHGQVEQLAQALIELDGGLGDAGLQALARLYLTQGRLQEARALLERSADNLAVPRCSRVVQAVLREAAQAGDLMLVDLPRCFAEQSGGELPGRRLFLDYCHLSVEGTLLAMRNVELALRPLLGSDEQRPAIADAALRPPPYIEACGSFCGALYNGRFDQGYEIIRHHADRALRLAPEIIDDMHGFLEHATSPFSKGIRASFLAKQSEPLHMIQKRLSLPKANWTVIRALRDAMASLVPSSHEAVDRTLLRHLDVTQDGASDVLSSPFWSRLGRAEHQDRMFYTCYEPALAVEFVAGMQVDMLLDLTLRVGAPGAQREQVVISVNEREARRVPATVGWQRVQCEIPARWLRRGVNYIHIEWPTAGLEEQLVDRRPAWGALQNLCLRRTQGPRQQGSMADDRRAALGVAE